MTDRPHDPASDASRTTGPIPWAHVVSSFAVGDPDLEAELVERIVDPEAIPTLFLVARLLGGVDARHDRVGQRLEHRWRAWLEERTYRGVPPSDEERPIVAALADAIDHRARRELTSCSSDAPSIEDDLARIAHSADEEDDPSDEFESLGPASDEQARRARWTAELTFAERLRAWVG